jgi:predicted RNA-binding protein YlxR (DUF448 family)
MTGSTAPRRTCVGCRAPVLDGKGVRVTRSQDGALHVGRALPGRGAWLCAGTAPACAQAASRRRAWGRALRAEVSGQAVEDLLRRLAAPPDDVGGSGPER